MTTTITNDTILGSGITLNGETLVNASAGTIVGNAGGGYAAYGAAAGGADVVVNFGSVAGIWLASGGIITNQSTGVVSDGTGAVAVNISNGAGTVVNGGSIIGGKYGVLLASGFANRVIVEPGAVFSGTVSGGNTPGSAIASTLELAAGTGPVGTFAGLGSLFVDFAQIAIDAGTLTTIGPGFTETVGGYWLLTGDNTIAAGVTLTNGGFLNNGGYLVNAGSITSGDLLDSSTLINGGVISGTVKLSRGAHLSNLTNGTISTSGRAVYGYDTPGTVDNSGLITSSGQAAVYFRNGGQITNAAKIIGGFGIVFDSGNGEVLNSGLISATTVNGSGIELNQGGYVSNALGGTITASQFAPIIVNDGVGTVINAGSIGGAQGIQLQGGGFVTNDFGGVITGTGIYISNSSFIPGAGIGITDVGTVANSGFVSGFISGVAETGGGFVTNSAGATITATGILGGVTVGAAGVGLNAPGTVVNSGLIAGVGPFSSGVEFTGGGVATNAAGATISAVYGIRALFSAATFYNSGLVNGIVALNAGGYVSNAASGTMVNGANSEVIIEGSRGTLINAGLIQTTVNHANGVYITSGGYISNAATGTIGSRNYPAVFSSGTALTVVNAGLIEATTGGSGIDLRAGGVVTNLSTGTISSATFAAVVVVAAVGTVINAGLIESGNSYSVKFDPGFADRLVVDPGARFGGRIQGGNTIGGTIASALEFAAGSTAGAMSGLGSSYLNFGQITIDAAASWALSGMNSLAAGSTLTDFGTLVASGATLSGAATIVDDGSLILNSSMFNAAPIYGAGVITLDTAGTLSVNDGVASGITIGFAGSADVLSLGDASAVFGTLSAFATTDTIDLLGINNVSSTTLTAADVLQISLTSGGTIGLQMAGDFTGDFFHHTSTGSDTLITVDNVPCFAAGTRIRTTTGEVEVETLRAGDLVSTVVDGGAAPIVWIGRRAVDCTHHPKPETIWPVRIAAAAFGPGLPARDLRLSPDHAVYVEDVLIPVRLLVNGSTVVQVPLDRIAYYHVELPHHDVVFAEGLPAESYLDVGDRANFANGGQIIRMHIDLAHHWEAKGCAPLVVAGPELNAARSRIARRATEIAGGERRIRARQR